MTWSPLESVPTRFTKSYFIGPGRSHSGFSLDLVKDMKTLSHTDGKVDSVVDREDECSDGASTISLGLFYCRVGSLIVHG